MDFYTALFAIIDLERVEIDDALGFDGEHQVGAVSVSIQTTFM